MRLAKKKTPSNPTTARETKATYPRDLREGEIGIPAWPGESDPDVAGDSIDKGVREGLVSWRDELACATERS